MLPNNRYLLIEGVIINDGNKIAVSKMLLNRNRSPKDNPSCYIFKTVASFEGNTLKTACNSDCLIDTPCDR